MSERMSDAQFDDLTDPDGPMRQLAIEARRAREAEIRLRNALKSVQAALGDRLLARGPLSKEYVHAVMDELQEALG